MSTEEYCLVPKNTLDRMMMKNEADPQITELPPDNYRLPQTHRIIQNISPDKKNNPNIKHMLSLYINDPMKLNLAESLLEYFKLHQDVKFDDLGSLLVPPIKSNILDVIQYLISNTTSSNTKIEDIKNFIHAIKFPKEFIHNRWSRKYLFENEFPSIPDFESRIPKRDFTPLPPPTQQITPPSTSRVTSYKSKIITPKKRLPKNTDIPKSDRELRKRFPSYQPYTTSRKH